MKFIPKPHLALRLAAAALPASCAKPGFTSDDKGRLTYVPQPPGADEQNVRTMRRLVRQAITGNTGGDQQQTSQACEQQPAEQTSVMFNVGDVVRIADDITNDQLADRGLPSYMRSCPISINKVCGPKRVLCGAADWSIPIEYLTLVAGRLKVGDVVRIADHVTNDQMDVFGLPDGLRHIRHVHHVINKLNPLNRAAILYEKFTWWVPVEYLQLVTTQQSSSVMFKPGDHVRVRADRQITGLGRRHLNNQRLTVTTLNTGMLVDVLTDDRKSYMIAADRLEHCYDEFKIGDHVRVRRDKLDLVPERFSDQRLTVVSMHLHTHERVSVQDEEGNTYTARLDWLEHC